MALFGGFEAGGTKFICIVGTGPMDIRAEVRFPTTTPKETLGKVIQFFQEQSREEKLTAVGIGSFGPVDLHQGSKTFGYITTTPKPGWAHTDILGPVQQALGIPVAFETDVNGSAVGEGIWGAAKGLDNFIYLTIGTGIGSGVVINGSLTHGLVHPESGHLRLPHDLSTDPFIGSCPYHGDCFEGLASGPAMLKRWGQPAETLPPDHPAWPLEANYVALALNNMICDVSPQRLILGGGVLQQQGIFPLIRSRVLELLNGYVQSPDILDHIDAYIVPPGLGSRSGVLGALALAQRIAAGR